MDRKIMSRYIPVIILNNTIITWGFNIKHNISHFIKIKMIFLILNVRKIITIDSSLLVVQAVEIPQDMPFQSQHV